MNNAIFDEILAGLADGGVVPYLGAGALTGVHHQESGEPIPADSDSLIMAMNGGRPMAPKLMYEFPRAAMNLELKRGRSFVTRFLDTLYGKQPWSEGALHRWLAERRIPYLVDINRDTQLQGLYRDRPHTLVTGVSRVGGTDFRFRLHQWEGEAYREVDQEGVDATLPVLFKPLGTPLPKGEYIASDADFVDYITELMGGFAIPAFLKERRRDKRYLLLGMRLLRDTERMVLADILYDAAAPTGWALIPEATDKERRFCEKKGITVIDADWRDLMAHAGATDPLAA